MLKSSINMQDNDTDGYNFYNILFERLFKDFGKVKFVFVFMENNYKNVKKSKNFWIIFFSNIMIKEFYHQFTIMNIWIKNVKECIEKE